MSKSAAIILSRQCLRPSLSEPWVRKLSEAVGFVKREKLTLSSSVGSRNWEIITACAVLNDVPLRLLLPVSGNSSFELLKSKIFRQFCLSASRVKFDRINSKSSSDPTHAQLASIRDESIIDQADILMPVSVRPGGNMSKLLSKSEADGKTIVREFETAYEKKKSKLAYQIDSSALSNKIKELEKSYLIHWTRATNSGWPDEKKLEFYKMIFGSVRYRRTAFDTLRKILSGQLSWQRQRTCPLMSKQFVFQLLSRKKPYG